MYTFCQPKWPDIGDRSHRSWRSCFTEMRYHALSRFRWKSSTNERFQIVQEFRVAHNAYQEEVCKPSGHPSCKAPCYLTAPVGTIGRVWLDLIHCRPLLFQGTFVFLEIYWNIRIAFYPLDFLKSLSEREKRVPNTLVDVSMIVIESSSVSSWQKAIIESRQCIDRANTASFLYIFRIETSCSGFLRDLL